MKWTLRDVWELAVLIARLPGAVYWWLWGRNR